MNINNKKTYEEIDARIEQLLEKGTELGGVEMLSEKEQEELTYSAKPPTIGSAKKSPTLGE